MFNKTLPKVNHPFLGNYCVEPFLTNIMPLRILNTLLVLSGASTVKQGNVISKKRDTFFSGTLSKPMPVQNSQLSTVPERNGTAVLGYTLDI